MRDVERLEEMKHLISVGINQQLGIICNEIKGEPVEYYVDAIDRIIERLGPYELGETILIETALGWKEGEFIAPAKDNLVWACPFKCGERAHVFRHRPIPRTKKLDVPVEKINDARIYMRHLEEANLPVAEHTKWLAEQAEDEDENTD